MKAVRATGAAALITTEKDAANLSRAALSLAAPTPIYALEIGIEIEDPAPLWTIIGALTSR